MVTESSAVMATDHEFEAGTSKLEIINQLLLEINYNTFMVNADGIGILSSLRGAIRCAGQLGILAGSIVRDLSASRHGIGFI